MQKMVAIAVVALLAATPAPAQTPEQTVAFLDRDGDTKISLNEYLAFQDGRMAQFNTDGKEGLSEKEFIASLQAGAKKNGERSYRAFNNEQNRNALTQREFLGYHAYVFREFVDADKDGFVTVAEWAKIVGQP